MVGQFKLRDVVLVSPSPSGQWLVGWSKLRDVLLVSPSPSGQWLGGRVCGWASGWVGSN